MAALNYADLYQQALDQVFPYQLYFGRLYASPSNGRYRWTGAKSIEIPHVKTSGRVNANRDSIGTAARNYDNDWVQKTLSNHRKWSTLVHPMDIDETNQATSITNITKTYNEEQKFPEMDAYTISRIHALYIAANDPEDTSASPQKMSTFVDNVKPTVSTVLTQFDKYMQDMDNARVPSTGRVLYVTPEIKTMLKQASQITRNFDVNSGNDAINRIVNRLDEVEVISVPETLMKTAYDFTTGWKVASTAKQIYMCLICPEVVLTPVKYQFSQLQAPSAVTEGKYYYYEESYEDVFLLDHKVRGIMFNVEA